jgi:hypothetical protein
MAMTWPHVGSIAFMAMAVLPATARAQSSTIEVNVTVGRSTDGTIGTAVQTRWFGASRSDFRVYLEATWGLVTGGDSDAFNAAYPYDRKVRAMELYTEKTQKFGSGASFMGVRAGRYRTPFGISSGSDYAYSGLLRAPLIRNGWNWALSNTHMDVGADVVVGRPSFSVESSIGMPSDEGYAPRRRGFSGVVRAQAYIGSLIVGASYINSPVANISEEAHGRMMFQGVDARWMRGGVQLRGEWIAGRSDDESTTSGGYIDVMAHHPSMGRVTFVGRVERLDWDYPEAPEVASHQRRASAGARVRIVTGVDLQASVVRSFSRTPGAGDLFSTVKPSTAFDLAVTFSHRF